MNVSFCKKFKTKNFLYEFNNLVIQYIKPILSISTDRAGIF